MTRTQTLIASLCATALLASTACGQGSQAALCDMGSAVAYLAHLKVTAQHPIDSAVTGASILFLAECPASVVGAFNQLAPYDTQTPHRWREAIRAAAGDSSKSDVRQLLTLAMQRVASVHDRALDDYTTGLFDAVKGAPNPDPSALQVARDRVVLEMLQEHAACEGDVCGAISDILVFYLGTHPVALLKAMHADSAEAKNWLHVLADESFSGVEDYRARSEAARRAAIERLDQTPPDRFARERRECLEELRRIRYRVYK